MLSEEVVMKRVLMSCLILLLIGLMIGCNESEVSMNRTAESMNIKGPVKSLRLRTVDVSEDYPSVAGSTIMGYETSANFKIVFYEDGLVERDVAYVDDDDLLAKRSYEYDENQMLIAVETFVKISEDMTYKVHDVYELNDEGALNVVGGIANFEITDTIGSTPKTYQVKHDEHNRVIEVLRLVGGQYETTKKISYHENGFVSETVFIGPDRTTTLIATYNDEGDVVAQKVSYDGEIIKLTYEYEHDEHGNWIVQREYREGEYARTVERTFEYY